MSIVTFLAMSLYLMMESAVRFLRRHRCWRLAMTIEMWSDRLFTIRTTTPTFKGGGTL